MESENIEWIISLQPKLENIKRRAIKECEHIISRHGKLTNYKKKSPTQLKFNCEIQKENFSTFLKELENYFSTENADAPELKKLLESKRAMEPVSFILVLTVLE